LAADSSLVRPVESGAWAFSRTLANEFQKLDIRRIDLATDLSGEIARHEIQRIMLSGTAETELQIDMRATRAVRVSHLRRALDGKAPPQTAADLRPRAPPGHRRSCQRMDGRRPRRG